MEENKKEEKKGIIGFALLVIAVILLGVGIGLLVVMPNESGFSEKSKPNNVENKEVEPPTPTIEELDIDSELVTNTMNQFYRISITDNDLYYDEIYNINNISKPDLIMTALKSLKDTEYDVDACSADTKDVPISVLNENLKKVFKNKEITYDLLTQEKANVMPDDSLFGPDSYEIVDENTISIKNTLCGIEANGHDFISDKIIKAEKVGENLYVYKKVAFARFDSFNLSPNDMVSYYIDYNRSGEKIETINDPHYGDFSNPPINWDLYNTYKYTFNMSDGIYYFQSYELVK